MDCHGNTRAGGCRNRGGRANRPDCGVRAASRGSADSDRGCCRGGGEYLAGGCHPRPHPRSARHHRSHRTAPRRWCRRSRLHRAGSVQDPGTSGLFRPSNPLPVHADAAAVAHRTDPGTPAGRTRRPRGSSMHRHRRAHDAGWRIGNRGRLGRADAGCGCPLRDRRRRHAQRRARRGRHRIRRGQLRPILRAGGCAPYVAAARGRSPVVLLPVRARGRRSPARRAPPHRRHCGRRRPNPDSRGHPGTAGVPAAPATPRWRKWPGVPDSGCSTASPLPTAKGRYSWSGTPHTCTVRLVVRA